MTGALLPGIGWPMLAVLLLVAFAVAWRRSRPGLALLLAATCVATRLFAATLAQQAVPCDERLMVEARVTSIPQRTPGGWRFDAEVSHPRRDAQPDLRVRIEFPRQQALRPRAGETWQLMLEYGAQGNAAGSRVMLRDRMHARARVRVSPLNLRLREAPPSWLVVREYIAERIHARVGDPAAAALIAALAVGATGEVSDRQWRVFSATGISHLVAISGMHVTFFAMLSMVAARFAWRRAAALNRRVRREAFAAVVGIALAAGYALLSGFSVPAQRTLAMLVAFLALREGARAGRPWSALSIATVAVLAWDPLAVLDAGFWLSYVAVAALVLLPGGRIRQQGMLATAVDVQWTVSLALLPLTLVIFGLFSVAGLAVNAVAIPVFTLLLVPGVLLATAGYLVPSGITGMAADRLVDLSQWIVRPMWTGLARIADLPGAVVAASPGPLSALVCAGAVVLVMLPLGARVRLAAVALLAWSFVAAQPPPTPHLLEVEMFDVGAETAVLVRTARHALLAGTGETFGSQGRRFRTSLLPALQSRLATGPDAWVLGRTSRDRLAAFMAGKAQWPHLRGHGVAAAPQALPPELASCASREWEWDGVAFALQLLPSGRGCLLEVRAAGRHVLLPIDADEGDWAWLAADAGPAPDVLLLPRRPRSWPESAAGRQAAEGSIAVASVSAREHASEGWEAMRARVRAQGYAVLATAGDGPVRLAIDAGAAPRRLAATSFWRRLATAPRRNQCAAPG